MDIAQFSIYQLDDSRFRLEVSLPLNLDPDSPVDWPAGCELLDRAHHIATNNASTVVFDVQCERGGSGLIRTRWGREGGLLQLTPIDGYSTATMLPGGQPGASIPLPDWGAVAAQGPDSFIQIAWRYMQLGAVHVLEGWDHLAFVLCLAMLATGLPLIALISAFTVGHSISLALAHFGLINIPIVPVEAVIALSVVFMAREALIADKQRRGETIQSGDERSRSLRWRMGITAGFGLVHGLGFASVLGGLGVSASETVMALAFFNIGVEVGQILFVLAALLVLAVVRELDLERQLTRATIFMVGGMGIFWTLDRILLGI